MSVVRQANTLPPAQPSYILRGHKAQIHSLLFLRQNSRLLSGDASGIVILWDIATKRPVAVWKAHDGGVLGLQTWGANKLLSHGRDGRVKVWQMREADEASLSTLLPAHELEETESQWKDPWMLHSLRVYALNFCAFAMCEAEDASILIATPAANEGATAVHSLPSEALVELIPPAEPGKTGMVMALRLKFVGQVLHLFTGYESGLTSVQVPLSDDSKNRKWQTLSVSRPHSQPILSLDLCIGAGAYFTSGTDAIIAMSSFKPSRNTDAIQTSATKHSGQQSLVVRSDGKIFATAGWDGRMRVYSVKSLKEVAVLKWHSEGCYAAAFAQIQDKESRATQSLDIVAAARMKADDGQHEFMPQDAQPQPQTVTVRQRRNERARSTHWLAGGSKDGKISLWDIF